MKTKEELNALKEEVEALNKKLHELTKEELAQVCGGKLVHKCSTCNETWLEACPIPDLKGTFSNCSECKFY